MNLNGLKRLAGLVALTVVSGTQALADDTPGSIAPQGDAPPEAVAACKDQREGTAVEFLAPNGSSIHGICKKVGDGLVAVPAGDVDEKGAPPAEAIGACQDQQEGATVEVPAAGGERVKGTCKDVGGRIIAVPDEGPAGDGKGEEPSRPDKQ